MNLYHYNTKKLTVLASQFARGVTTNTIDDGRDIKDPFYYGKNLSFFFEPIPEDLPDILHGEHKFWKKGQVLFEHVININQLPYDVPYRIVETYDKTELLYRKQNWDLVKVNPSLRDTYMEELHKLEEEKGYIGIGRDRLKAVLSNLPYNIRKDYENLYRLNKENPSDNLMDKYAATVPHLMAYTTEHTIKPKKVIRRTLI